jgi:uncharacterized membrane-anchored protein YhcB (DUF1043 family)
MSISPDVIFAEAMFIVIVIGVLIGLVVIKITYKSLNNKESKE